jgi:hypothetical protein
MKKALLIGINYFGSSCALNGCITDVVNMKHALLTLYGFTEADITVLTDEPGQALDKIPTKDNILKHMGTLVTGVQPGDSLVFHYSGHGTQIMDVSGDEITGLDDALVPVDYETNGYITDDAVFIDLARNVSKGVTLHAFFDCCHSGTVADLEWNFKYVSPHISTTDLSKWGSKFKMWQDDGNVAEGTIVLYSGCYDEETSADAFIDSKGQGAFTFCLLSILSKPENLHIKHRDLLKQVNAYLHLNGFVQRSQFSCSDLKLFDANISI